MGKSVIYRRYLKERVTKIFRIDEPYGCINFLLRTCPGERPGKNVVQVKLGVNVGSDEFTNVTKYKVKIFYSHRDIALSAKLTINKYMNSL